MCRQTLQRREARAWSIVDVPKRRVHAHAAGGRQSRARRARGSGLGDRHRRPGRRTRRGADRRQLRALHARRSRCGTATPRAPRTFGWSCRTTATWCCTDSTVRRGRRTRRPTRRRHHLPSRRCRTRGRRKRREGARGGGRRRRAAPQAPAPPPPPPPPPAPRTYTVVSGDTLWAIAEQFYGDGNRYRAIAEASGIANPDLIHPGQVLTIP